MLYTACAQSPFFPGVVEQTPRDFSIVKNVQKHQFSKWSKFGNYEKTNGKKNVTSYFIEVLKVGQKCKNTLKTRLYSNVLSRPQASNFEKKVQSLAYVLYLINPKP